MLHFRNKWRLSGQNEEQIESLINELGMDPLAARLLSALRIRISARESSAISPEEWMPLDAACQLGELHQKVIEDLQRYLPAEEGRTGPRVLILGVNITDFRSVGDQHQHLKLTVRQDETTIECVGYDLGYLTQEITPFTNANLVAEPILREWNGIYKIQLLVHDLEIPEMQIFDYREMNAKQNKLSAVANSETLVLCFREESLAELESSGENIASGIFYISLAQDHAIVRNTTNLYTNIVIYDTPFSMEQFYYALSLVPKPERIYCLFGAEYKDRLAVLPGREQFKWLYAVLKTRGSLQVRHIPQLAKSRGLSEQTVLFMLDVFLELDFIYEQDATYSILPTPSHRELDESKKFRRKKSEMELETEILYSSYGILCKMIKEVTL